MMRNISFPVFEGIKRVLLMAVCVVLFLVICLAISAVAGRYAYHTYQPMGMGYTLYMGGRLIGSH